MYYYYSVLNQIWDWLLLINMCHILWQSPAHEKIMLPHEIAFVLILYFIRAILSKKMSKQGAQKVKERGTRRFAIERGFSNKGQIKPVGNAFTRKF